jgi:hypothetical protein
MLLLCCGLLGPYLSNKRANLGGGSFNLSNSGARERKESRFSVDFHSIIFHNAIQRLGTDYAMEPRAADGKLGIGVKPIYSPEGERVNFCAVVDASIKVNPAVAKPICAYLTIKYETDSVIAAPSIRGAALLKPAPGVAVSRLSCLAIWLERDFAPFPTVGLGRQVTPKNPVGS